MESGEKQAHTSHLAEINHLAHFSMLMIAEVESVNVNKWAIDSHFCLFDSEEV